MAKSKQFLSRIKAGVTGESCDCVESPKGTDTNTEYEVLSEKSQQPTMAGATITINNYGGYVFTDGSKPTVNCYISSSDGVWSQVNGGQPVQVLPANPSVFGLPGSASSPTNNPLVVNNLPEPEVVEAAPAAKTPNMKFGVLVTDYYGTNFVEESDLGLVPRYEKNEAMIRLATQTVGDDGVKKAVAISKKDLEAAKTDSNVWPKIASVINACEKFEITLIYPSE